MTEGPVAPSGAKLATSKHGVFGSLHPLGLFGTAPVSNAANWPEVKLPNSPLALESIAVNGYALCVKVAPEKTQPPNAWFTNQLLNLKPGSHTKFALNEWR